MKKTLIIVIFILFLAFIGGIFYRGKIDGGSKMAIKQIENPSSNSSINENPVVIQEATAEPVKTTASEIPASVLLDVPFMSQAPFQKWDALHEDACEEASLLTVKHFIDKDKLVSKELAEKEIQEMIKFENKNGYGKSITLDKLSQLASQYYKMNTGRVENNITIDGIKKELMSGHPVIIGAAGKVLPNPNFKNGGPNYHMLVIKGYDAEGFITNDPGTRLGESFRYTFDGLFNAIHDWNAKNILNGGKDYLVFD